jgi:hypothetical protein
MWSESPHCSTTCGDATCSATTTQTNQTKHCRNILTCVGIGHRTASRMDCSFLFRPQMMMSCPRGACPSAPAPRTSASARAVVSTGPIPSPPPIRMTAGSVGCMFNCFRRSSCKKKRKFEFSTKTVCLKSALNAENDSWHLTFCDVACRLSVFRRSYSKDQSASSLAFKTIEYLQTLSR